MDTRICALCGRGEKSLMGQGDLIRFEPTSGFNPFRKTSNRTNSKRFNEVEDSLSKKGSLMTSAATCRRARVLGKGKESSRNSSQPSIESEDTNDLPRSQSQPVLDAEGWALPMLDELSLVGHPEDTDANDIFEKSGHVYAHHCCAAWSEGVAQKEDLSWCNVDKAVSAGLSQKCNYCLKYGATIRCKISNCSNKYHYPCASGGGCFQDIKSLSLLCPDHADQAIKIASQEACCVVCDEPGCISDQLFCTSCGQHYHGNCLDPTVEVNPIVRAGWQCPECKICQTCRQPGDDNKMLVCDTCDKGYHTFCLKPVMSTIPKNGWKCKNCRVCGDCGSRTPGSGPSSRWHLNYSVCDSCYQQRNKGLCCPLCGKAYRHFAAQNKMLLCRSCKRHIHSECDENYEADPKKINQDDYVCLVCRNRDTPLQLAVAASSECISGILEDNKLQDIENFGIFKVLKEGKIDEGNSKRIKSEESSKETETHVLQESSASSSDLDLKVLDKNLSSDFGGMDDHSLSKQLVKSSDSKVITPLSSSSSTRGSAALNQGKPQFNQEQFGKKIGARNKSRSVGVGKKKRPTHSSDRKRGPKPKIKQSGSNQQASRDDQNKDEEHTSTLVICSAKDQFTLKQDMCLSCGSFGKGEEGKLIACVQCGQCYHPYCVSIKVSPSMLEKGWRCLDCTVCEGCGKPHDESRLILCDECDISFHIYCLDPPLEEVPQGAWKCKWCIVCLVCGENSPGTNCQWQDNYSKCGPCGSLERCPMCFVVYNDNDLIIQCGHCERWLHGACDGIRNEDDAESAMDATYHCPLCRPVTGQPGPVIPVTLPEMLDSPLKPLSPAVPPFKDSDFPRSIPKTFIMDGVCLSEAGLVFIRKQSMKLGEKKRNPSRWKKTVPTHPGLQVHLASISSERSEEDIDGLDQKNPNNADLDDCKMDGGQEDDLLSPSFVDRGIDGSLGTLEEKKKRPRMRMGMGVGGFIPRSRARGGSAGRSRGTCGPLQGKIPCPMETNLIPGAGDVDEAATMDGKKSKQRRPRKMPKRSHLEDAYPSYLQDAFFGRELLDQYKPHVRPEDIDLASEEPLPHFARTSSALELDQQQTKGRISCDQQAMKAHAPRQACDQATPSSWAAEPQARHQQQPGDGPNLGKHHQVPLDPLDVDSLDKDQAIDSLDQLEVDDIIDKFASSSEQDVLAQIDNETLEDILKNGLNGDPQQESEDNFGMGHRSSFTPSKASSTSISPLSPPVDLSGNLFSHGESSMWSHHQSRANLPTQQQQHFHAEQQPMQQHQPGMFLPQQKVQPLEHHPQQQQQQMQVPQQQEGEEEEEVAMETTSSDNLTCNQRNVKKWESDEMLGDSATISQVLYANMCHPELKQQYPEWSERVKQIAKLWRKVPTEKRGPYLAKARGNRAAYRSQNSQKETKKKQAKSEQMYAQQQQQQQQQQEQISQSSQEVQNAPGSARDASDPYGVPPATPQTSRSPSVGGFLHPSSQGMTASSSGPLFKQPHPKTPMMQQQQQHYDSYPGSRPPSRDYHVLHQHQTSPMEHFSSSTPQSNETSPSHFAKHPFASPSPSMHLERSNSVDVMKQHQQYQSPRHSQDATFQGGEHAMSQLGHSPSPGANMMSPQHQQSPKIGRSMVSAPNYQRSISDPYGGIRPPSDPYSQPPSTPRPELYGMYGQHSRNDPYAQPPATPRSDQFNQPTPSHLPGEEMGGSRPSVDPFVHHPRANMDPYSQMPMTPRPGVPSDPYMQPPLTPRPSMGAEFNQQMMGNMRPGTSPLHHININHTRMMQQQNMMLQQTHSMPGIPGSEQFQNQGRLMRPSTPLTPGDASVYMGMQQRMPAYEHMLPARHPGMNPHHMMNKEVYHHMSVGGQKPGMPVDMYARGSGMIAMRGPVDFGARQRHNFDANYPIHQKFSASSEMYAQQPRLTHDLSGGSMRYPAAMSKPPQQMSLEVHEQEQVFLQQQHFQQQMHQAQLQQQKQQDGTNQSQGDASRPGTAEHHLSSEASDAEVHAATSQDPDESSFLASTSECDSKSDSSKQQLRDLLAKQSNQKQKQKKQQQQQEEGGPTPPEAAGIQECPPASTSSPSSVSSASVTQTGHAPSGSSTPLKHWPMDGGYEGNQQPTMRTTNVVQQSQQQPQQMQQQLHHLQAQHQQNILHQQEFSQRWPDQQQSMMRIPHPPAAPSVPPINQQIDQSQMASFQQQQQQQQQQNCLMNESQLKARFLIRPVRFSSPFQTSTNMQFPDDPTSYQYQAARSIDPRHQQIPDQQQQSLQLQQQVGMRMLLRQGFMQQHQQLHPRMFQQVSGSDGAWKLGFPFQQAPQHLPQNQHIHQQQQQQMQQQFFKASGNAMSSPVQPPHQGVDQSMPQGNFGMHHQITSLQHLLNQNQTGAPSSASAPPTAQGSTASSMLLGGDSPGKMVEGNTDDQIEDLLGSADDGFNLLEYADDDLECNDKTIFDEHLGLIPPPPPPPPSSSSSSSSSNAQTTSCVHTNVSAHLSTCGSESNNSFSVSSESNKSTNDFQTRPLEFGQSKSSNLPATSVALSSANESSTSKAASPTIARSQGDKNSQDADSRSSSSKDVEEEKGKSGEKSANRNVEEEISANGDKKSSPRDDKIDSQVDGSAAAAAASLDESFEDHPLSYKCTKKAKLDAALSTNEHIASHDCSEDKEVLGLCDRMDVDFHFGGSIGLSPICQLDGAADEDAPSADQGSSGRSQNSVETSASDTVNNPVSCDASNNGGKLFASEDPKDGNSPLTCNKIRGNAASNETLADASSTSSSVSQAAHMASSADAVSFPSLQPTQQLHAQPQTVLQLQQHVQALQQRRMLLQQQQTLDPRLVQQQHLMMMARAHIGLQQTPVNMDQFNPRHDIKSQEELIQQHLQLQQRLQQQQLLQIQQTRQAVADVNLQRFSAVAPPSYQATRAAWARLPSSSAYPLQQQMWDVLPIAGQQLPQQLLHQQLQQQQIIMQQQMQQQQQLSNSSLHLNQKLQDLTSSASSAASLDGSPSSAQHQQPSDAPVLSIATDVTGLAASVAEATSKQQSENNQQISSSCLVYDSKSLALSVQSCMQTNSNQSNDSSTLAPANPLAANVDLNVLNAVSTSVVNALLAHQLQRPSGLVCIRTGAPAPDIRHQQFPKDAQQRMNLPGGLIGQSGISIAGGRAPYLGSSGLAAARMMPMSSGLCIPRIARPLTQFNPMSAAAYQQQFSQGGRVITSLINMSGQLPPQSILSPKFFDAPDGQLGARPPKPHGEQPLLLEDLLEEAKQEQRRKQAEQQQTSSTHPPLSSSSSSSEANNVQCTITSSAPSLSAASIQLPLLGDADFEKLKVDAPTNSQNMDSRSFLNRSQLLAQQQQLLQKQQSFHAQQDQDMIWQSNPAAMDGAAPAAGGSASGFPIRPPGLPLPVRMPSSFVMSPQSFFDPSGLQMPASTSTNLQDALVPPAPQRPSDPPAECTTEEEKLVQKKFEEWLVLNEQWLSVQVQSFCDQIAKFRKTKKALTAKQRAARKNGNELNGGDALSLEETSKEQSRLQKQLDQLRKQQRSHKTAIQEYKAKHQPVASMLPQPPHDDQQVGGASTSDQPMFVDAKSQGGLRAPGAAATARLPPSARQEYEQYVQERLKQVQPQGSLATVRTTLLQGDENNPFSETYQQREKVQKLRLQAEHQRTVNQVDIAGPSPAIENLQFPVPGGDQQFQPTMAAGQPLQPGGMRHPFLNYPLQQAPVNPMQFVGPTAARFGMRYPSGFPGVDNPGALQQHCSSTVGDAFQLGVMRPPTAGSSTDMTAFHPAQPSILKRTPVQPENNVDQQQQMMMMMMMKNNFPSNIIQPTDMTNINPLDSQQRILQQLQQQQQPINQFSSTPSFGQDAAGVDDSSAKMASVQDAILRKLLDSNKVAGGAAAATSSAKMSEDEEESVNLTPEQQRTLAIIESMPLTIETNKDEAAKKSSCDKEGETASAAGDAHLQQLVKTTSKPRHRRSPTAAGTVQLQPHEGGGGTKKRQKKNPQQTVSQQQLTPQQMNQQQMLQQQIMQHQFQEQLYQQQHDQQLMRQMDRSTMPVLPIDSKAMGRIDHTGVLEQLVRQLQLQPTVLLKEPDVAIAGNQFLHHNLKQGFMEPNFVGSFGSARSACLPSLDFYFNPPFITPPWTPKVTHNLSEVLPAKLKVSSFKGKEVADVPSSSVQSVSSGGADHQVAVKSSLPSPSVPAMPLPLPFTVAATSSKLQMVTSVLNKNLRPPTGSLSPPIIESSFNLSDSSPMTIISSSSPEPSFDDQSNPPCVSTQDLLLLPGLKLSPKHEFMDSILDCASVQAPFREVVEVKSEIEQEEMSVDKTEVVEVKPEMSTCAQAAIQQLDSESQQKSPKSSDHVSVMLTLSVSSAENISGVIAAIANLLKIAVPPTYEITRSPSPNPDHNGKTPWISGITHRETAVNIQSLMRTKTRFCKNCDAVIVGPGVGKPKSDFFLRVVEANENERDELLFCGTNCCLHFSATCKHLAMENAMKGNHTKPSETSSFPHHPSTSSSSSHPSLSTSRVEIKHSLSGVYDAKLSVIYSPTLSRSSTIPSNSLAASAFSVIRPKVEGIDDYPVEAAPRPSSGGHFGSIPHPSPNAVDPSAKVIKRLGSRILKHKSVGDVSDGLFKSKKIKYESKIQRWRNYAVKPERVQKLCRVAEIMERQASIIKAKPKLPDGRSCVLCKISGDAETNGPGRLLLLNSDKWVHLNCALWSYEVYETMNGALVNVDQACRRGISIECIFCSNAGATISCFRPRCTNVYHLDCAIKDKAAFYQDKTILCHQHANRADVSNILSSLSVFRRVYINKDEDKQVARAMQHEDRKCMLRAGNLIVHNIGQLLLHQIQSGAFNNHDYIYPVGFKSSRFYWSYRQMSRRCRYVCKIEDKEGLPEFSVSVFEKGFEQLVFKSDTCKGAWLNILEPLEKMRRDNDLVKMFPSYLSGEDLFGLTEPSILKLIESLPGIELSLGYNFKYGRTPLFKLPLAVNPSGCARTEPKLRMHFKRPHTLHSGSSSRSLPSTVSLVRSGDNNSPYLKQFVHSKTQQYRRLKNEWRNNVYLRRSNIQGLGLFAARELEKHTMVIEYIGELIRTEVAEKREKIYEKNNHGVYMFRIDETNYVVDATMSGGPARYVNHSCNPNCVAEVVPFEKEKDHKIIIITKRKIALGEELCYDYKFDLEDDQHKIPCLCGSPNCRKWMN